MSESQKIAPHLICIIKKSSYKIMTKKWRKDLTKSPNGYIKVVWNTRTKIERSLFSMSLKNYLKIKKKMGNVVCKMTVDKIRLESRKGKMAYDCEFRKKKLSGIDMMVLKTVPLPCEFAFPKEDLVILPIRSTTVECLSEYIHSRLKGNYRHLKFIITVNENAGSSGSYGGL
ncbi:MAG: hypothetical protein HWN67_22730 [Candidatus Helarchaeota archaeon]|nr:hypothetical protein [Candidatus Helarchaeota archaeon]